MKEVLFCIREAKCYGDMRHFEVFSKEVKDQFGNLGGTLMSISAPNANLAANMLRRRMADIAEEQVALGNIVSFDF